MFGQASNLFGSQPVTTSLYQQPSTTQTTSMFNTQPSVSTPSSNLFGQGPPQPSVTAPLMFGQSQPAAPIQPIFGQIQNTSSVPSFGSSVKVGPTNTTSLFGLNTQSQSNTAPATLGFGQTTNNAANQLAQSTSSTLVISKDTKYDELSQLPKDAIDDMEKFIQSQINISQSLLSCTNQKTIEYVDQEAQAINHKLKIVKNILKKDVYVLEDLRQNIMREFKINEMGGRLIERFQNPHLQAYTLHIDDSTSNYFEGVTNSLEYRVKECIDAVNDIEYFLSRQNAPQNDLGAISMVIHEQYNAFIRAANTVAELHGRIDKVSDKSEEYNRMVFGASVFRSHASTRVNKLVPSTPLKVIASKLPMNMEFQSKQQQQTLGASMFTAPAPVQPFGVGSIFGAKATSNTGMFGTTQPATSNSGMFGTTQPATSNFGIPAQPATSGLFGALATPGSSMFGNAVGGGQGNLFGKRNNE